MKVATEATKIKQPPAAIISSLISPERAPVRRIAKLVSGKADCRRQCASVRHAVPRPAHTVFQSRSIQLATQASLPCASARTHHEGAYWSVTRCPPAPIAAATRASA